MGWAARLSEDAKREERARRLVAYAKTLRNLTELGRVLARITPASRPAFIEIVRPHLRFPLPEGFRG